MTGLFREADLEWIPKLIDILKKGDSGNPDITERTYYSKFGFNQIDITGYSMMPSIWPSVVQMCNERYLTRRINSETMELWQTRIQRRFDELAPKWERYLELYDQYEIEMNDNAIDGWTETDSRAVTQSGTDTADATGKTIDTPDSAINADDDYADSLSRSESSVTYGRKDTHSGSIEHIENGDIVGMVNRAAETKRLIITDIAGSFEDCFLNVFWY